MAARAWDWKKVGITGGRNFLIGGILLGMLAVIIEFINPHLAGHLSGGLPMSLTFVLLSTYFIYGREKTGETAKIAIAGGLSWILYAFILYVLVIHTTLHFWAAFAINLFVFSIVTYLIIRFISYPEGFIKSPIIIAKND
jgi:heme A synthase